jgi:AcrR family transcriptional regulator
MPRPKISEQVQIEQQEAILSIAVEQIAEKGYELVRLRDIAKAAGVSVGLLQHRFESRDELLGQAFEHHCTELLSSWQTLSAGNPDPWSRIVALIDRLAYSGTLLQRATVWADFASSSARRPDLQHHLRLVYAEWRMLVTTTIEAGVEHGIFVPRIPVDQAAEVLIAQIDGALLALAGDVGYMTGERLHELMTNSARVLLGYDCSDCDQKAR